MKIYRDTLIISMILILFLFCACCKFNNDNVVSIKPFTINKLHSEYFDVSILSDTSIYGNKGTEIIFKKGCFSSNMSNVRIELKEFYNISDIICNGLTTTSNENILETLGMVYLNVINDSSQSIIFNTNMCFIKKPRDIEDRSIILFYGDTLDSLSLINWTPPQSKNDSISLYLNELNKYYSVDKLGWLNFDKFLKFKKRTNLSIELSIRLEHEFYVLIFNNFNSILPCNPNSKGIVILNGIPQGEPLSLVGFGMKDDEIYFRIFDTFSDANQIKMPKLKHSSRTEIKLLLDEKFGERL